MCDKDHFAESVEEYEARGLITRRQFGVLVGAGVAMMLPGSPTPRQSAERDVEIKTPDGTADAYFVLSGDGSGGGRPDLAGHLRAAAGDADDGQAARASPGIPCWWSIRSIGSASQRPPARRRSRRCCRSGKGMSPATDMSDAKTFIAWLDAQPQVNKNRKVGVQGYCMGGPMSFHTASAVPDRVGAVASFHGGGLVGKDPADQSASAGGRDEGVVPDRHCRERRQAAAERQAVLKETFDKAKLMSEIEVYPAAHGWCPPDTQVYNEPAAEKAWTRLLALYGKALA